MRKLSISLAVLICAFIAMPQALYAQAQPITYVRRSEAAMLLLKNAGAEIDINIQSNGIYPDVVDGESYTPYVLKAIELGILDVSDSGLVYPYRSISRADFLHMMTTAFGLSTNLPYEYTDIDPADEMAKYAGLSWRYNLFDNDSKDNVLRPNLRISHTEAAKAVYTLLKAEPSLQETLRPIPTKMIPTITEKTQYFPSAPKSEPVEQSSVLPRILLSLSTPISIKNATLKLIGSRENLAEQTRNDLIGAVNAFRATYNVQPLRSNYDLEIAAQRHAKDMAQRGYFSHYTPEGLSYIDRTRNSGYLDAPKGTCDCMTRNASTKGNYAIANDQTCSCTPTFAVGENLAKGQLTVKQVMDDWKASPHHRENMLRPEFDEIGIGLYEDLWVQAFGHLDVK